VYLFVSNHCDVRRGKEFVSVFLMYTVFSWTCLKMYLQEVNLGIKLSNCNILDAISALTCLQLLIMSVCSLSQTIMVKTTISHELDLGASSTWTKSIVHRLSWIVLLHSTSTIMHRDGNQHTTC